jgi:hypothetical protein
MTSESTFCFLESLGIDLTKIHFGRKISDRVILEIRSQYIKKPADKLLSGNNGHNSLIEWPFQKIYFSPTYISFVRKLRPQLIHRIDPERELSFAKGQHVPVKEDLLGSTR